MLQQGNFPTWKGDSQLPVGEIVLCPHQPGSLKISRGACAKRHLLSKKSVYFERLMGNSPLGEGYSLCRKCSTGKRILREEKRKK